MRSIAGLLQPIAMYSGERALPQPCGRAVPKARRRAPGAQTALCFNEALFNFEAAKPRTSFTISPEERPRAKANSTAGVARCFLQEAVRILGHAGNTNLEVQVRPGRAAGGAESSDVM